MPFHEGFLSEIVGKSAIVLENGTRRTIGRVTDFVVNEPHATFPRVDSIVVKTKGGTLLAPSETMLDIDSHGVILTAVPTEPAPPEDEALYLIEDLFDKQIVDVDGRKLVRINDLEIANTGGVLRVVAADIGLSGLLRRLGATRLAPIVFDRIPRSLISWNDVAPIDNLNPSDVRLQVSRQRLARLHPSDLAEIISELSTVDAARVLHELDDETAADALEHLEPEKQKSLIEEVGTARAADIIEEMDSDDAADLLGELPERQQSELLAEMEPETAGELRELSKYEEDTAGGMMTTDYVWIYGHRTAAATIVKLREIAPETEFVYYLYVVDQIDKLLGVLSLRSLLLAEPDEAIETIMDTDPVHVVPDTSAHDVAGTIARYDLLACPVLDEDGRMLGIVTVDDAIDAILPAKLKRQLPRFTHSKHRKSEERSAS